MPRDPDADPKWKKVCDAARRLYGYDVIWRFRGEHFFMSNMYTAGSLSVKYEGLCYPSTEHSFAAAKTLDCKAREGIRETPDPKVAKQLGRQIDLRDDWEDVKLDVMLKTLRSKFSHPQLAQQLLATGSRHLLEGNLWHDTTWGMAIVDGELQGDNELGELLMQVRADLSNKGVDACSMLWKSEAEGSSDCKEMCSNEEEVIATAEHGLSSSFSAWLRAALGEELSGTDCECTVAALEVILASAEADDEALDNAAQIVEETGAPCCAAALRAQWHSDVPSKVRMRSKCRTAGEHQHTQGNHRAVSLDIRMECETFSTGIAGRILVQDVGLQALRSCPVCSSCRCQRTCLSDLLSSATPCVKVYRFCTCLYSEEL